MGIMQKKVTRRVAIGSLAGGLAGTAVVLRVLKGPYNSGMPTKGKYSTEWEKHVKAMDERIKEVDGPAAFTLDFLPEAGRKFRVNSIEATYDGHNALLTYPQLPSFYSAAEGVVTAIRSFADTLPAFQVKAKELVVTFAAHAPMQYPGGECMIVPVDSNVDFFGRDRQKLSLDKVNQACFTIANWFVFAFPKRTELMKGAEWTIPAASPYCAELPCKVVGFADVAGKKTAKMLAQRKLDARESRLRQELTIKRMKDSRRSISDLPKTQESAFQFTAYVDLVTGTVLRQEGEVTVRDTANPANNQKLFAITRVEPS